MGSRRERSGERERERERERVCAKRRDGEKSTQRRDREAHASHRTQQAAAAQKEEEATQGRRKKTHAPQKTCPQLVVSGASRGPMQMGHASVSSPYCALVDSRRREGEREGKKKKKKKD